MTLLDTNAILRYLLADLPEQTELVANVIKNGAFTIPEVVAEVVYVFYKLYNVPRKEISGIVAPIFDEIEIEHKGVIKKALELYSSSSLDFVDCIICYRNKLLNEKIFSFDKKLNNKLKSL